jgi:hypothetical protein
VDAVEFSTINDVTNFNAYSSASLTARGGISTFTILDEQLITTANVPEPSSLMVLSCGLIGMAALAARRYRAAGKRATALIAHGYAP